MNASIENIVYTEFTKKNVFGQLTCVDPWVRPNRKAWGAVHHYSPAC